MNLSQGKREIAVAAPESERQENAVSRYSLLLMRLMAWS